MLQLNELVGFGDSNLIARLVVGTANEDQADLSTYTFSAQSYNGAADANRFLVGFACTFTVGVTLNAASIGGVSATILGPSVGTAAQLWGIYANVKTGTSGNVVLAFSGTCPNGYFGLWSIYPTRPAPISTSFPAGGAATARSVTLAIPYGGIALVAAGRAGGSAISNATNSPAGPSTGCVYGYRGPVAAPESTEFAHASTRTIGGMVWI